jgi:ATP-dependent RNA helicase DeaD
MRPRREPPPRREQAREHERAPRRDERREPERDDRREERRDDRRDDRRERGAREPLEPGAWFTINVGRYKNADPKWLIPLLCRRGGITKRDIGKIQILARETRVEIAPGVSDRFAEAVRRPDPKDPNIHIERLDAGG